MKDITSTIWFKVITCVVLIAIICLGGLCAINYTCPSNSVQEPETDKVAASREAAEKAIAEMHKPAEINLNGACDWQFEYLHGAKWDLNNRYKQDPSESRELIYNVCPKLVAGADDDDVTTLTYLRAGMHKVRFIASVVRSNMYADHNFAGMKSLDSTIYADFNNEDFDILLCGLKQFPNTRAIAFRQYFEKKLNRFNGRMDLAFADMYIDACVLKYAKRELAKGCEGDKCKERIATIAARLADVHYNVRRSLFLQAANGTEREYDYDIEVTLIEEFKKLANEDPEGCVEALATLSKAIKEGTSILP